MSWKDISLLMSGGGATTAESSFILSVFTSLSAGALQEGGVARSTAPHSIIFQPPAGGT